MSMSILWIYQAFNFCSCLQTWTILHFNRVIYDLSCSVENMLILLNELLQAGQSLDWILKHPYIMTQLSSLSLNLASSQKTSYLNSACWNQSCWGWNTEFRSHSFLNFCQSHYLQMAIYERIVFQILYHYAYIFTMYMMPS